MWCKHTEKNISIVQFMRNEYFNNFSLFSANISILKEMIIFATHHTGRERVKYSNSG